MFDCIFINTLFKVLFDTFPNFFNNSDLLIVRICETFITLSLFKLDSVFVNKIFAGIFARLRFELITTISVVLIAQLFKLFFMNN
jgi:hypothetical protein